jgi:hypothetical protein
MLPELSTETAFTRPLSGRENAILVLLSFANSIEFWRRKEPQSASRGN